MNATRKAIDIFSEYNRKKKAKFIANYISRNNIKTCLVVGASRYSLDHPYVNLIEKRVEEICDLVVMSGLEEYGGRWRNWVQADGRQLPFKDQSFDLVLSNAVVEHVGDEEDQRKFMAEHARVGKWWIATTPNRLFPVESHTGILLKHMKKDWRDPSFTRLLSKKDLDQILPSNGSIQGSNFHPTFISFKY